MPNLKPSNILITKKQGKLIFKIADFGLARSLERVSVRNGGSTEESISSKTLVDKDNSHGQSESEPMFTKWYASPEQWYLKPSDLNKQTDIFSFGIVVYELFTKKRPFDIIVDKITAKTQDSMIRELYRKGVEDALDNLSAWNQDWHVDLKKSISKCLKVDPLERYNSFEEILDDLKKIFDTEHVQKIVAENKNDG